MFALFYLIFLVTIYLLNSKTTPLFSFRFVGMMVIFGFVFNMTTYFGKYIGNDYHSNDYYGSLSKEQTAQIESKKSSKSYQHNDLHWNCTKLARASAIFTSPIHIFNEYFIVAKKDDKSGLTNCYYRQIHNYNVSDKYWEDYTKAGGQLEAD